MGQYKAGQHRIHRIHLDFESKEKLNHFLAWLSNSGEQDYMNMFDMFSEVGDEEINYPNFDYSKAFPAWGYIPSKHGHPTVKVTFEQ